jgi:ATP-dependent RNA helicase DDX54/DBP10
LAIDELKSTDGILDLMGDSEQSLAQQRTNKRKWDPVSHKYVSAQSLEKKQVKKIKSESGHWIPITYKSDRYEKWQEKTKLKNSASEENNEEEEKKIAPCKYCYNFLVNYKINIIVRIQCIM